MKRLNNKVIGIITAMAMMTTSIICTPVNTIAESKILASGVWYESIYVEWAKVDNAQGYNAYYKQSSDTAYQRIDDELVLGDGEITSGNASYILQKVLNNSFEMPIEIG